MAAATEGHVVILLSCADDAYTRAGVLAFVYNIRVYVRFFFVCGICVCARVRACVRVCITCLRTCPKRPEDDDVR